jgi:hypothetical protein
MSGSKSDYLEAALLNLVLGGTAWTAPATTYIALSTAAYSDAATGANMSEVSSTGTAYARVALTNNATNWPAATGTSPTTKANGAVITFTTASGSGWGTVTSFYIVDAASGGNVLYGGDLTASKTITSGDTASFAAAGIQITED